MLRILVFMLAPVLAAGAAQLSRSLAASAQAAASRGKESASDLRAEREMLDLANQARTRARLAPLQAKDCLAEAARGHAAVMAAHQQISHQFPGEPSLSERLAASCPLHLEEAAENVAVAGSVSDAHNSFLRSPPHRENLLHPSYDAVGFGVVRRGSTLYVVEDFAHSLPAYSAQEAVELIAKSIDRMRADAKLPRLRQTDNSAAQNQACALARADSLRPTRPLEAGHPRYILRYTSMRPESLPSAATKALEDRRAHEFAVGACLARSATYPNGAYWVVLAVY